MGFIAFVEAKRITSPQDRSDLKLNARILLSEERLHLARGPCIRTELAGVRTRTCTRTHAHTKNPIFPNIIQNLDFV